MLNRRQFVKSEAFTWAALAVGRAYSEDLREDLVCQAREVFAKNLVVCQKGSFHVPSATTYPGFYAWDAAIARSSGQA